MAQYATVELGQIASVKSGYSFKRVRIGQSKALL